MLTASAFDAVMLHFMKSVVLLYLVCVRAVDMWRPLGCADSERFALVWESEELKALNNTLFSFVKNKVLFSIRDVYCHSEMSAIHWKCKLRNVWGQ